MLHEYPPLLDNKGQWSNIMFICHQIYFFFQTLSWFQCFSSCNFLRDNLKKYSAKEDDVRWCTFNTFCHCATEKRSDVEDFSGRLWRRRRKTIRTKRDCWAGGIYCHSQPKITCSCTTELQACRGLIASSNWSNREFKQEARKFLPSLKKSTSLETLTLCSKITTYFHWLLPS